MTPSSAGACESDRCDNDTPAVDDDSASSPAADAVDNNKWSNKFDIRLHRRSAQSSVC